MSDIKFSHYSVLLNESIEGLAIKEDGIYIDATAGGGGHSLEIAKRLTTGKLIAIDRDDVAIEACRKRLADYLDRVILVKSNFSNVQSIVESLNIESVNGAIIDLGVSSCQLDTAERGFSYMQNAPLDMRMDREDKLTAWDVVNTYSEAQLKEILYKYGEENFAPRIAHSIVTKRMDKTIDTTGELADIVRASMPVKAAMAAGHPAKRTFQAIRIEVNGELDIIEPTVRALSGILAPGGRLSVITFHSLEDRIVKNTIADLSRGCVCPPDFPVCVCGRKPIMRAINKKPILPSEKELSENSRSKSAKLRVAEKL